MESESESETCETPCRVTKQKKRKGSKVCARKLKSVTSHLLLSRSRCSSVSKTAVKLQLASLKKKNHNLALALEDVRSELKAKDQSLTDMMEIQNQTMLALIKLKHLESVLKSFSNGFEEALMMLNSNCEKWRQSNLGTKPRLSLKNKMQTNISTIQEAPTFLENSVFFPVDSKRKNTVKKQMMKTQPPPPEVDKANKHLNQDDAEIQGGSVTILENEAPMVVDSEKPANTEKAPSQEVVSVDPSNTKDQLQTPKSDRSRSATNNIEHSCSKWSAKKSRIPVHSASVKPASSIEKMLTPKLNQDLQSLRRQTFVVKRTSLETEKTNPKAANPTQDSAVKGTKAGLNGADFKKNLSSQPVKSSRHLFAIKPAVKIKASMRKPIKSGSRPRTFSKPAMEVSHLKESIGQGSKLVLSNDVKSSTKKCPPLTSTISSGKEVTSMDNKTTVCLGNHLNSGLILNDVNHPMVEIDDNVMNTTFDVKESSSETVAPMNHYVVQNEDKTDAMQIAESDGTESALNNIPGASVGNMSNTKNALDDTFVLDVEKSVTDPAVCVNLPMDDLEVPKIAPETLDLDSASCASTLDKAMLLNNSDDFLNSKNDAEQTGEENVKKAEVLSKDLGKESSQEAKPSSKHSNESVKTECILKDVLSSTNDIGCPSSTAELLPLPVRNSCDPENILVQDISTDSILCSIPVDNFPPRKVISKSRNKKITFTSKKPKKQSMVKRRSILKKKLDPLSSEEKSPSGSDEDNKKQQPSFENCDFGVKESLEICNPSGIPSTIDEAKNCDEETSSKATKSTYKRKRSNYPKADHILKKGPDPLSSAIKSPSSCGNEGNNDECKPASVEKVSGDIDVQECPKICSPLSIPSTTVEAKNYDKETVNAKKSTYKRKQSPFLKTNPICYYDSEKDEIADCPANSSNAVSPGKNCKNEKFNDVDHLPDKKAKKVYVEDLITPADTDCAENEKPAKARTKKAIRRKNKVESEGKENDPGTGSSVKDDQKSKEKKIVSKTSKGRSKTTQSKQVDSENLPANVMVVEAEIHALPPPLRDNAQEVHITRKLSVVLTDILKETDKVEMLNHHIEPCPVAENPHALNLENVDLGEPLTPAADEDGRRPRRRRAQKSYKEIPLNKKMRRNI